MFIISTFNGRYGIYRNDHPNFYFNTMNISSSAALQANTTLLNSAQKQLLLANKYYDQGEYDRSFHLFCRSVENSNRLLDTVSGFNSGCYDRKARYRIFTSDRMKDYQIEDRFKALKELFTAIDQRDEQLDLLHDFLVDSGMELYGASSFGLKTMLYRQMLLSFVAGMDNFGADLSQASSTNNRLEEELNFRIARTAYLKNFMEYQSWSLRFAREILFSRKKSRNPRHHARTNIVMTGFAEA